MQKLKIKELYNYVTVFLCFQFEHEKLSTVEDKNEMFSKLAAKVHTFLNGCGSCSWATIFPFLYCLIINTKQSSPHVVVG
jgi:hypothetical protein